MADMSAQSSQSASASLYATVLAPHHFGLQPAVPYARSRRHGDRRNPHGCRQARRRRKELKIRTSTNRRPV